MNGKVASGVMPLASEARTGQTVCVGSLGTFEVLVLETETKNIFEVAVLPATTVSTTSTIQVHVVSQAPEVKALDHAVELLKIGSGFVVGKLTLEELEKFSTLWLTPTDNTGTAFLQQVPTLSAKCELPIPE